MTHKHSMVRIVVLLLVTIFSGMALSASTPTLLNFSGTFQTIKPTSTVRQPAGTFTPPPNNARPTAIPREMQAGHSDWITTIAIVIVVISVVPLLIKRAE